MTIGNALAFMNRGLADAALRERLNGASSLPALHQVLQEENLMFSDPEFDEAFRHRLIQCQEAEEADQLKEFKMWWDLLLGILRPSACDPQGSGCCQ